MDAQFIKNNTKTQQEQDNEPTDQYEVNGSTNVDQGNTEGEGCHIAANNDRSQDNSNLHDIIMTKTKIDDSEAVVKSVAADVASNGASVNHQSGVAKQCNNEVAATTTTYTQLKNPCDIVEEVVDMNHQQIISAETKDDWQHQDRTKPPSYDNNTNMNTIVVDAATSDAIQRDDCHTTEAVTYREWRAASLVAMVHNHDDDDHDNLSLLEVDTMPGAFPTRGRSGNDDDEHDTIITIDHECAAISSTNHSQSHEHVAPEAELVDEEALRAEILGQVKVAEVVPEAPWLQRSWKTLLLVSVVMIASIGTAIGLVLRPSPVPDFETVLLNDACSGSIPITSMDGVIVGSTIGATADNDSDTGCGFFTSIDINSHFLPPGIWFSIQGRGMAVTLSTCSSSTEVSSSITVFEGSCDNLVCVTTGAIDYNCQGMFVAAAVTSFWGDYGKDYWILVYSTDGGRGRIGLNFTEFHGVENDFCRGAVPFEIDEEIVGTIAVATAAGIMSDCGLEFQNPDLWYFVIGTGDVLAATACDSSFNMIAVSVFGGNCTSLQCIGSVNFDQDRCASLRFFSTIGETYYILLVGYSFGQSIDFSLFVNASSPDDLGNELCSGAQQIDLSANITIFGSTVKEVIHYHSSFDDACLWFSSSVKLWYSVIGTGEIVAVTVCDTSFNLLGVSVFGGSCTNLQCIGSASFDRYRCTSVRFLSVVGETHHILLGGDALGQITDFSLFVNVSSAADLGNGLCSGAQPIDLTGNSTILGSIIEEGILYNSMDTCYLFATSRNLWYSVIGNGDVLTATACDEGFNLLGVSIFGGNCTELQCTGNANFDPGRCTSVRYLSAIEETYYIVLTGHDDQSSDFTLFVNSSSAADLGNELCSGAQLIDLNVDNTIFGSTAKAIHDNSIDDTCATSFTFPVSGNRWYQVVGNGAVIVASLCSPYTDFDTQIAIYASVDKDNSCASLDCVAFNDDACNGGFASQTEWLAEKSKIYYIRVNGFASAAGHFALDFQENTDILSRKSV